MNDRLAPYRLEWRRTVDAGWTPIKDLQEHPGDLKEYVEKISRGNWRLISQHVIETVTVKERKV